VCYGFVRLSQIHPFATRYRYDHQLEWLAIGVVHRVEATTYSVQYGVGVLQKTEFPISFWYWLYRYCICFIQLFRYDLSGARWIWNVFYHLVGGHCCRCNVHVWRFETNGLLLLSVRTVHVQRMCAYKQSNRIRKIRLYPRTGVRSDMCVHVCSATWLMFKIQFFPFDLLLKENTFVVW